MESGRSRARKRGYVNTTKRAGTYLRARAPREVLCADAGRDNEVYRVMIKTVLLKRRNNSPSPNFLRRKNRGGVLEFLKTALP